jgi:hypothetical protein
MQELDLCANSEPVIRCRIVCLCSNCRSVLSDFLSREQDDLNEGQTWLWETWISVGAMEQEVSGLQQAPPVGHRNTQACSDNQRYVCGTFRIGTARSGRTLRDERRHHFDPGLDFLKFLEDAMASSPADTAKVAVIVGSSCQNSIKRQPTALIPLPHLIPHQDARTARSVTTCALAVRS